MNARYRTDAQHTTVGRKRSCTGCGIGTKQESRVSSLLEIRGQLLCWTYLHCTPVRTNSKDSGPQSPPGWEEVAHRDSGFGNQVVPLEGWVLFAAGDDSLKPKMRGATVVRPKINPWPTSPLGLSSLCANARKDPGLQSPMGWEEVGHQDL